MKKSPNTSTCKKNVGRGAKLKPNVEILTATKFYFGRDVATLFPIKVEYVKGKGSNGASLSLSPSLSLLQLVCLHWGNMLP